MGLNLVFLTPGQQGGMEVYAREVIRRLAERDDLDLTVFVNRDAYGGDWGRRVREVLVPVRAADRKQWLFGDQVLLPPKAAGFDVVHSMASTAPVWGRFRRVTTIHDVAFMVVPDAHAGMLGVGLGLMVRAAARRSHRIISGTDASAVELVDKLKVPREKIDVVPHGVNPRPTVSPTPESQLRAELELGDRPVVLCVSPKRPSKNLERLIRAHAGLATPRPVLVLPGYSTPHESFLRSVVDQLGTGRDVRFMGWVSTEDLEGLYELSALMAFPSLYEGFGLPPLEAMARGLPVVCSDRGAVAEVVGHAALLVDPESVDDIRRGLEVVLHDDALRGRLVTAGSEHVPQYTWDRAADMTADVYWKVMSAEGSSDRAGLRRATRTPPTGVAGPRQLAEED